MTIQLKRNDTKDTISYFATYADGEPVNLTGATVRFLMGTGKKVITDAAAAIKSVSTGQVEYTLTDADTLVAGTFKAEFEVTFSDGKVKTFPTNGYIMVNIQPNIDLDQSTYIEDQIANRVSDLQVWKNEIQAQLDQFAVGDSAPEVAQARVEKDGTTNTTLKARLDKKESEFSQKLDEHTSLLAKNADLTQNRISTSKKVRFIAHRGASLAAPENTLKAYEIAGQLRFWGAECDVQLTADGKWAVIHDDTLDRTTNGTGRVIDFTLEQIRTFTIDGGSNVAYYPNLKVPTLEEFLLVCKQYNLHPYIEVKDTGITSANYLTLVNTIIDCGFEENCTIIGNDNGIKGIREHSQKIRCEILTPIDQVWIDKAIQYGNCGIDAVHTSITKELVQLAHSQGITVNCWSTNSYTRARELMAMNVDFISSDTIAEVL